MTEPPGKDPDKPKGELVLAPPRPSLVQLADRAMVRIERVGARFGLLALRVALFAVAAGALLAAGSALVATWHSLNGLVGLVFDGAHGALEHFGPLAESAWGVVAGLFQATVTTGFAALTAQVARVDERLVLGGSTPSRVPIHEAWCEDLELHGRPGLAVYLSVEGDGLVRDERLELTLRLRTSRGDYLGSLLAAFRGTRGEFLVRSLSPPWSGGKDPFQDCGLFVPLRAVDLPPGTNRLRVTVEILVASAGEFLSQYDLKATLTPDEGHPCRVRALPAPTSSTSGAGSDRDPAQDAGSADLLDPALASADAPIVLEEVRVQVSSESLCPVCGDGLDADSVQCSVCETPHHADCWAFAGRCATFACEGTPTAQLEADRLPPLEPSPEPAEPTLAPSLPVPVPAGILPAALRRTTPPPAPVSPGSGWAIRCPDCRAEVTTGPGGRCPACHSGPAEVLPAVAVPPLPPGLWQSPMFALPAAAAVVLAPVAAALALLAAFPIAATLLFGFASLPFLADPQAALRLLRVPLRYASGLLDQAFPTTGIRDASPRIRIASIQCRRHFLLEGDGTEAVVRLLVRGLAGRSLDVSLRLRGPDGAYLAAADPVRGRGVYGEFCIEYRTAPLEGGEPGCREVRLSIPSDLIRVPPGAGANDLTAEVLVGCEGHLLSEADVRFPWAPVAKDFTAGRTASGTALEVGFGGRDRALEPDPERLAEAGVGWCPLCTDGLDRGAVRCRVCARRSHPRCWEFLAACPACGTDRGADA